LYRGIRTGSRLVSKCIIVGRSDHPAFPGKPTEALQVLCESDNLRSKLLDLDDEKGVDYLLKLIKRQNGVIDKLSAEMPAHRNASELAAASELEFRKSSDKRVESLKRDLETCSNNLVSAECAYRNV